MYEFTHSAQKVRLGGFKVYAEDPGLLCALAPATSDGLTRALETAVYLEMRRRASSRVGSIALLKLKSGKEIDFIEGDEAFGIAYELIQVSLNMENEATRQSEVSALQEAIARFEKRRRNHSYARRRNRHQRPRRRDSRNASLEMVVGIRSPVSQY